MIITYSHVEISLNFLVFVTESNLFISEKKQPFPCFLCNGWISGNLFVTHKTSNAFNPLWLFSLSKCVISWFSRFIMKENDFSQSKEVFRFFFPVNLNILNGMRSWIAFTVCFLFFLIFCFLWQKLCNVWLNTFKLKIVNTLSIPYKHSKV